MKKLLSVGFCILVCALCAFANGEEQGRIPEIDAGSLSAVLALVSGGILMLRAKSRSK